MITIFIRTLILFFLTILVIRAMGKRQLAQLQPFEVVITLMIAELAAVPMGDVSISLFSGVISILTLLFAHALISLLSYKSERFRSFVCGKPNVLIRHGRMQHSEMERLCFDLSDLLEGMRSQGVLNIADVECAILETNGTLNVFPKAQARPAHAGELGLSVGYEGVPLVLILDGVVQTEALTLGKLDRAWLTDVLRTAGVLAPERVLLASVDTAGRLYLQEKGLRGRLYVAKVLDADSVCW